MSKKPQKRKRKVHDVSLAPAKLRSFWSQKAHDSVRQRQVKITLPAIPPPRSQP